MAVLDAFVVPDPTPVFAARRGTARGGFVAEQSSVTTYFYFTAAGAFGSTTDPAAVPSTAGIVRTVTT
jgi:hypothetical protein